MGESQPGFEALLANLRSAELKKISQRWGGSYQSRKEEALAVILDGLRDPEHVREVVARLPALERVALGLVRLAGGRIEANALASGLRASGVELPKARTWHDRSDSYLIRRLIESGIVLSTYAPDPTYVHEYGTIMLVADERLLRAVEPPPYLPLRIAETAAPAAVLVRRPAAVGMDLAAALAAIEGMSGLQLTKAGDVRIGDIRKLARALKWPEDALVSDGLRLLQPASALAAAIAGSAVIQRQADRLVVRDRDSIVSRPYAEQIGDLLPGFVHLAKWREEGDAWGYTTYEARYPAMRLALIVGLAALPDAPGAFFSIDDLSDAIFERVGEHLSLSYGPHPIYLSSKTPAEVRKAEEEWRAKLRAEWRLRERPWIERALTSWIYFLGLVELGIADSVPVSARLSDLGRLVLRGGDSGGPPAHRPSSAAWVVQPDFEVIVYLDHATPAQVAFVERHAERLQAQAHVARYRLTRDSVHRGLESGTPPDRLLEVLREGTGGSLPQNVLATLRDWASLRERITLRRSASILEFPDGTARDFALQAGLDGQAIGERFVLVSGARLALPHVHLDYARPLTPCLAVSEDGLVRLAKPTQDLLIRPQIERWAESVDDTTWRLTAGSVAEASRSGGGVEALIARLRERLIHALPPLLAVALRAWAGRAPSAALATVAVLRCSQPEVFAAITTSSLLAPYLHGTLAPDVLLVRAERLAELRQRLAWAGFVVSEHLVVQ